MRIGGNDNGPVEKGPNAWEAWHFGYTQGPAPCSAAGDAIGAPDGHSGGRGGGLPAFVPAAYRAPILRAAARWDVSAGLLAAQLEAESGFDPRAVSPAGAQGIAQFIPSTAHAYGLANPFNATAAIGAQAHLMADLLHQFGLVPLAPTYSTCSPRPSRCDWSPEALRERSKDRRAAIGVRSLPTGPDRLTGRS